MTLLHAREGNIAIVSALALPVLLLIASVALDFQNRNIQTGRLQEIADTLALRGAWEFMLANANAQTIESVVRSIAESGLPSQLGVEEFTLDVAVDMEEMTVSLVAESPAPKAILLSKVEAMKAPIVVRTTAVAQGGMKVCVVALDENSGGTVSAADTAYLDARPCSILSNSASPQGVIASDSAQIVAGLICSAGGSSGSGRLTPAPTHDCPVYDDPLASRAAPPYGACDHTNFVVGYFTSGGDAEGPRLKRALGRSIENVADITNLPILHQRVSPGVYCGGLKIKERARVTFDPGIYVIKDGPLEVDKGSELDGRDVGFYLAGADSVFSFDRDAKIAMSAPKTGPLAGILFFEDRAAPLNRIHSIRSEDAREFLGTFYLSRGVLEVDTRRPVADASAYTAIVARRVRLKGSPTLVLNADYASTDVPVPAGVGPVGGSVALRN